MPEQNSSPQDSSYPPIADYALIGDCHSAALVSTEGSIDWCCLPRFDSGSCFGRVLDWERGGFFSITPVRRFDATRRYVGDTLVLETTFRSGGGEARLIDCFTMRPGGRDAPHRQVLRVVEGIRGRVDFRVTLIPRFDYGELRPWIRQLGSSVYGALGGNDGLIVSSDCGVVPTGRHDMGARLAVRAGDRYRISLQYTHPEELDGHGRRVPDPAELDHRLEETLAWWRSWSSKGGLSGPAGPAALRSAIVLKALTNAPTGAIAAAPTTSLPEEPGGARNWDYRFSWIRDSCFTVRSLAELGFAAEADGFRRFVERSAAGSAEELQIMYGVGGERRLTELELDLDGYRGARPVRVGNAAHRQVQLDMYGALLDLAWRWEQRGHSPDDDYWRFLVDLVNTAAVRWEDPDRGIWEVRGAEHHFVHSKVMCWAAVDRGIQLARACARRAPLRRWTKARDAIREAVETKGFDGRRKVFRQAFGTRAVDSALLLLPTFGFLDWDDPRMVRTVDVIGEELSEGGLLVRYRSRDGLKGHEGVFLSCTFWLVECLARQGRYQEARAAFDRAMETGNDLGLFAEEYDVTTGQMLGNFPQGLTHLSHIAAAVALKDAEPRAGSES